MTNYGKVRPGNHRPLKSGAKRRLRGTVAKTTKERAEYVAEKWRVRR